MFKFLRNIMLFIMVYWFVVLIMTLATSMTTQMLLKM